MASTHLPYAAYAVWDPLPSSRFDAPAAAHLLRRAGVSATPEAVRQAVAEGLDATVEGFLKPPPVVEDPGLRDALFEDRRKFYLERRKLADEERRRRQTELRKEDQAYQDELFRRWSSHLLDPASTVAERLVVFLFNVFVVSERTVRNSPFIFRHLQILRDHLNAPFPDCCKAVSRSPAMMRYLNIDQSSKNKPNENFARELMELFVLGEGNYSEIDVKEAARAFTGYRLRGGGEFVFDRGQHDGTEKTIFGKTGNFDGDDVIDILFGQPAARTFLPGEFLRTYLSEEPVEPEVLQAIGEIWARNEFRFDVLCRTVFKSRLFFDDRFRANMVKDPVQVLFGSLQDLRLGLNPSRRYLRNALRAMGQDLLAPPNVRGWVGGRDWISGATLSARRETVGYWFEPLDLEKMNADERVLFEAELAKADRPLRVDAATLARLESVPDETLVDGLLNRLLAPRVTADFRAAVRNALGDDSRDAIRDTVLTLMQTAEYQLC